LLNVYVIKDLKKDIGIV